MKKCIFNWIMPLLAAVLICAVFAPGTNKQSDDQTAIAALDLVAPCAVYEADEVLADAPAVVYAEYKLTVSYLDDSMDAVIHESDGGLIGSILVVDTVAPTIKSDINLARLPESDSQYTRLCHARLSKWPMC